MKPGIGSPEYALAISVEKMRASDSYTIENFVSSKELMHRAAMGIFESVQWQNKKIAIVCGSGNNGGDGYALAKILAEHNIFADVFRLSDKFSQDGIFIMIRSKRWALKILYLTDKRASTGMILW